MIKSVILQLFAFVYWLLFASTESPNRRSYRVLGLVVKEHWRNARIFFLFTYMLGLLTMALYHVSAEDSDDHCRADTIDVELDQ